MRAARARSEELIPMRTVHLAIAIVAVLALTALPALAQWGPRDSSNGFGLSFASGGDEVGARLELSRGAMTFGGGYFDDDDNDGSVLCAEVGLKADRLVSGYEGAPFVIGAGYYRLDPDDAELDQEDDFALWAGMGDFDFQKKGLFYQFRYILMGPLTGGQGSVGWAF